MTSTMMGQKETILKPCENAGSNGPSLLSPKNNNGEVAASELWYMIHHAPQETESCQEVARFADSQHGRTLHHPLLKQPENCNEQSEEETEAREATLRKRLSEALIAASPDGNLLKDDMESPTSTLQFPSAVVPSENKLSNISFPSPEEPIEHDYYYYNKEDEENDEEGVCVVSTTSPPEETIEPVSSTSTVRPSNSEMQTHSEQHSFVVCADTQLGMTSSNREWETELQYSLKAVKLINSIHPRPSFCCVCGDLVDMQESFYTPKGYSSQQCHDIQDQQNEDFKQVWQKVHPDIALVCLCGNHDVGNRPTPASIDKFVNAFGDDYLAFWVNGTYNVVLNSSLFGDPSLAEELYQEQLQWLQERLEYATAHKARQIFVFSHHPWFLYHEEEEPQDLEGVCPFPQEWNRPEEDGFYDYYFHIPKQHRKRVLALFQTHKVKACFSGHFHQNSLSKASWGMDMIVTAPLSMVFESTGKPSSSEKNARGVRVVQVDTTTDSFVHHFETLE